MFTPEDRLHLRNRLLERAKSDSRITGVAFTGSAADRREDEWSDIDLAFGVGADIAGVIADFTAHMYDQHQAVHHTDVLAGPWTYRVFLLANTLQVDLAFVIEQEFRALSPSFQLVSGKAQEPQHWPNPCAEVLIGMAWLHALHVRSCIARGKLWQAEYMINGVRNHALALACLRHNLSTAHGRGIDQLPPEVTASFAETLVRHLDADEVSRAFRAVMCGLLTEVRAADAQLAARLGPALAQFTETTGNRR